MKIIIVVDNLRMGGIQRLALDQLYFLNDLGFDVSLVVLTPKSTRTSDLLFAEREEIERRAEKVFFIQDTFLKRLIGIFDVVRLTRPKLVMSHSVSGTPFFTVARLLLQYSIHITLTIHQFPSFSKRIQLIKRFIYCNFADSLFSYSVAVSNQWDNLLQSRYLYKLLYRKKNPSISVVRNGIYPERLKNHRMSDLQGESENRIVYVGRLKSWKGVQRIKPVFDLLNEYGKFKILIFAPDPDREFENSLESLSNGEYEFVYGKTISHYSPRKGDIHVFPVDYGASQYIESISISCLEMGYMGIPSMVTIGGLGSWPELCDSKIFYEVDWESPKSVVTQFKLIQGDREEVFDNDNIKSIVHIRHNVSAHLAKVGIALS